MILYLKFTMTGLQCFTASTNLSYLQFNDIANQQLTSILMNDDMNDAVNF